MEICKKKGLLYPEILFENIYEITPEFLAEKGIRGLLLDLDNTIAPYEIETPNAQMHEWYVRMQAAGIRMAFVSNNAGERVTRFNQHWKLPQICKARKPFSRGMKKAIAEMGLSPSECAALGDQLFTDCIAAHRSGVVFYIVPPIKDKTSLFFRSKRFLERPFIRAFRLYRTYLANAAARAHCIKDRG